MMTNVETVSDFVCDIVHQEGSELVVVRSQQGESIAVSTCYRPRPTLGHYREGQVTHLFIYIHLIRVNLPILRLNDKFYSE